MPCGLSKNRRCRAHVTLQFTSKSPLDGSTVLHEIIQDICQKEAEHSRLQSVSSNPFVASVLAALAQLEYPINWCNEYGLTHFHIACMADHAAAIQLFSENWQRTAVRTNSPIFPGYTELHFAARFSNFEATKILLTLDAEINTADAKHMTPLHLLIKRNIEIADMLNKKNAENVKLLTAEKAMNGDIICLLLAKCNRYIVDDVACIMGRAQLTEELLGELNNINRAVNCKSPLFSGNTALHFAALVDVEKVKLLLQKGADISVQNAKKQAAFDLCLERYEIKDLHDVISSQPQWNGAWLSVTGKSLLDLVRCMETLDLSAFRSWASLYVDPFVDRSSALWPGYHLLHLAVVLSERDCKSSDAMVIEKLVSIATSFERVDKLDKSPVHLAFQLKKSRVVNCLLGARTWTNNIVDRDKLLRRDECYANNGLSHLHVASLANNVTAVEELFKTGCTSKINAITQGVTDDDAKQFPGMLRYLGCAPLHLALEGRCEDVICLLVEHGADVLMKNPINDSIPLYEALKNKQSFCAGVFISNFKSDEALQKRVEEYSGLTMLHFYCCVADVQGTGDLLIKDGVALVNESMRLDSPIWPGYSPLHILMNSYRTDSSLDGIDFLKLLF